MIHRNLVTLMCLVLMSQLFAVPHYINFQGKLTDDDGVSLGDEYLITFGIYPDPSGGTPLWIELQDVDFNIGLCNVLLGETEPIPDSIFDGSVLYIQVSVEGTPLLPRKPIVTVPYAFRAKIADSVIGGIYERH